VVGRIMSRVTVSTEDLPGLRRLIVRLSEQRDNLTRGAPEGPHTTGSHQRAEVTPRDRDAAHLAAPQGEALLSLRQHYEL
jgi:hypothetical protein